MVTGSRYREDFWMDDILVVGGAGYIGAHMVALLHRKGLRVHTLDDLSAGFRESVKFGTFVLGDMGDVGLVRKLIETHAISTIVHLAGSISVSESIRDPAVYYLNNTAKTLSLAAVAAEAGVSRFIFSSTAAVYGNPIEIPLDERHPKHPVNPYGRSKWLVEQALPDFEAAYGMQYMSFRYFNASGANPSLGLGERHDPETHLIPNALHAALGSRGCLTINGTDWGTPDGTCVRDFLHVEDLCEAHYLGYRALLGGCSSGAFNLGTGRGHSVREVVETASEVSKCEIPVAYGPRRAGDPPSLVANPETAMRKLGWRPKQSDIRSIIEDAWIWEQHRVGGVPLEQLTQVNKVA